MNIRFKLYSYIITILFQVSVGLFSKELNSNKFINGSKIGDSKEHKEPQENSMPYNEKSWTEKSNNFKKIFIQDHFPYWNSKSFKGAKEFINDENKGLTLRAFNFNNYKSNQLTLYILHSSRPRNSNLIVLNPLNEEGLRDFLSFVTPAFKEHFKEYTLTEPNLKSFAQHQRMFSKFDWAMAYLIPSGLKNNYEISDKKNDKNTIQNFKITYDKCFIGDIRRSIQTLRNEAGFENVPLWIQAEKNMAAFSLYAGIFEQNIQRFDFYNLRSSNVFEHLLRNRKKSLNISNALSVAIENTNIILYEDAGTNWQDANSLAEKLGWKNRIKTREIPD